MPTIKATGVTNTKAHGQAITHTEMAEYTPWETASFPPKKIQVMKVRADKAKITEINPPVMRVLMEGAACKMRLSIILPVRVIATTIAIVS